MPLCMRNPTLVGTSSVAVSVRTSLPCSMKNENKNKKMKEKKGKRGGGSAKAAMNVVSMIYLMWCVVGAVQPV